MPADNVDAASEDESDEDDDEDDTVVLDDDVDNAAVATAGIEDDEMSIGIVDDSDGSSVEGFVVAWTASLAMVSTVSYSWCAELSFSRPKASSKTLSANQGDRIPIQK